MDVNEELKVLCNVKKRERRVLVGSKVGGDVGYGGCEPRIQGKQRAELTQCPFWYQTG